MPTIQELENEINTLQQAYDDLGDVEYGSWAFRQQGCIDDKMAQLKDELELAEAGYYNNLAESHGY
jgi:hypothetical protein